MSVRIGVDVVPVPQRRAPVHRAAAFVVSPRNGDHSRVARKRERPFRRAQRLELVPALHDRPTGCLEERIGVDEVVRSQSVGRRRPAGHGAVGLPYDELVPRQPTRRRNPRPSRGACRLRDERDRILVRRPRRRSATLRPYETSRVATCSPAAIALGARDRARGMTSPSTRGVLRDRGDLVAGRDEVRHRALRRLRTTQRLRGRQSAHRRLRGADRPDTSRAGIRMRTPEGPTRVRVRATTLPRGRTSRSNARSYRRDTLMLFSPGTARSVSSAFRARAATSRALHRGHAGPCGNVSSHRGHHGMATSLRQRVGSGHMRASGGRAASRPRPDRSRVLSRAGRWRTRAMRGSPRRTTLADRQAGPTRRAEPRRNPR